MINVVTIVTSVMNNKMVEQYTEAEIIDLEFRAGERCLVCGKRGPCFLNKAETSGDPNWPGSPCTFDISPEQMYRTLSNLNKVFESFTDSVAGVLLDKYVYDKYDGGSDILENMNYHIQRLDNMWLFVRECIWQTKVVLHEVYDDNVTKT